MYYTEASYSLLDVNYTYLHEVMRSENFVRKRKGWASSRKIILEKV